MKRRRLNTLTSRMVFVMITALVISQALALFILQTRLESLIASSVRHVQIANASQTLRHINEQERPPSPAALLAHNSAVIAAWSATEPEPIGSAQRDAPLEPIIIRGAGLSASAELRVWRAGVESWTNENLPGVEYRADDRITAYGLLHCAIQLEPGEWLNFVLRPQPRVWPPSPPLSVFLVLSLVFIGLAAAIAAQRIAQPLRAFTNACERLTAGEPHTPINVEGPDDVQRAQTAFNVMGSRLHATVRGQQALLAAIGHDLRTPLTSLRVRAELLADEGDKDRITRALDELQELTEAALDAASSASIDAPSHPIDLSGLVFAVCDDLVDLGAPVRFREPDTSPIVDGWPQELLRAVRNVVENAVRYGERAQVRLDATADTAAIIVTDEGPGIPEADHERVFDPLVRLETSRSKQTGGHGLGLHIARNTIAAHQGDIALRNREEGGLEVTITLPIAR